MTSDAPRFARAVMECKKASAEALECGEKLLMGLKNDSGRDGISLFEVKNHDVLAYLTEMAFIMERMVSGGSIQVGGAVERIVKYRTVLERLKPIEKKLETQVSKIIQAPFSTDSTSLEKSTEIKVNQEAISETEDEEAPEIKNTKVGATKFVATYDNSLAEKDADKKIKRIEKNKRRALNSTLVQELHQQFGDAPIEEFDDDTQSNRTRVMDRERIKHEETFLMRTRLDKKEIKRRRKEANVSAIDKLLDFGNYMAADDDLRNQVLSHKKLKLATKRKMRSTSGPKRKFDLRGKSRR